MAHSRLHRNYQIFKDEVVAPFEFIKLLSNGYSVGKCHMKHHEGALTLEEIENYIKNNHTEPIIELE